MSGKKKIRIDLLLGKKYPQLSRSRVQAEIMAGRVWAGGQMIDKAGTLVNADVDVVIKQPENPFVSRGGLKLEGALQHFNFNVKDKVVLDVGASTGGFTDCLLTRGAGQVIALDVGYGQLALSLREDNRVTVMERFNVRNLTIGDLPRQPDLAVIDVSFISLELVLPVMAGLGLPEIIALVKPQFETGRAQADRGAGVIRDPLLHAKALEKIVLCAKQYDYSLAGMVYSSKPGPKGNIEYFIHLVKDLFNNQGDLHDYSDLIGKTVKEAHQNLIKR